MSVEEKDKKDFEFIKEEVIQKKHKKRKKWIIQFTMTILMAIIFGLVAAITFCISEPRLYDLLHKEKEVKNPVTFPTTFPGETVNEEEPNQEEENSPKEDEEKGQVEDEAKEEKENHPKPTPVVINQIEADKDDFLSMYDDIRTVAYHANKSMVTISSIVSSKDWFGDPVEMKVDTTGLVVANNGADLLILVSLDRIKNASSIKLKLTETDSVDANLQDYESELNLAVLAVNLQDIPSLYLENNIAVTILGESYTITVGNPVLALGNPNGYLGSMDLGIITSKGSAINITDNKMDLFNTSMNFNSESDGIIVNMRGEVIGLITRTLKADLNEQLSTVIGISKVKSIIENMVNNVPRIYCGVVTEDLTDSAKKEYNVLNGIYVSEVRDNSPAKEAGMKDGDIILTVEDKSILNTNSFYNILAGNEPGEEVYIKVKRTNGTTEKEMNLKVTLSNKER